MPLALHWSFARWLPAATPFALLTVAAAVGAIREPPSARGEARDAARMPTPPGASRTPSAPETSAVAAERRLAWERRSQPSSIQVRSQGGGSGLGSGTDIVVDLQGTLRLPGRRDDPPLPPAHLSPEELDHLWDAIAAVSWDDVEPSYSHGCVGCGNDRIMVLRAGVPHVTAIDRSGAADVPASLRALLAETKELEHRYRPATPPEWPPPIVEPRAARHLRGFVTLDNVGGWGNSLLALSVEDSGECTWRTSRPAPLERTGHLDPVTVARLQREVKAVPWPHLREMYTGCNDCPTKSVAASVDGTWYRSGFDPMASTVPPSLRQLIADLESINAAFAPR